MRVGRSFGRAATAAALVAPAAAGVVSGVATAPTAAAATPPYVDHQGFAANANAQSFTLPPGVTQLAFDARGGQGGSSYGGGGGGRGGTGGYGAQVVATIGVTPGQVFVLNVGFAGSDGDTSRYGFGGYGANLEAGDGGIRGS